MVNLLNIGFDSDGGVVIDRVEDVAPSNDGLQDSTQSDVASFETIASEYVYPGSEPGISVEQVDVPGLARKAQSQVDPLNIGPAMPATVA